MNQLKQPGRTISFLGDLVSQTESLKPGQKYTFTFEHGRLLEIHSDSWVFSYLRDLLRSDMDILSVKRPFFSDRYVITFIPKLKGKLLYFIDAFRYAWQKLGYSGAQFLMAETGVESTAGGGLDEITKKFGEGIGQASTNIIKPVLPYLVIAGIFIILIQVKSKK